MYEIVPSTKALVPIEQVGSTYVLYCLYNQETNYYFTDQREYIRRRFKYFITQANLVCKSVHMNYELFTDMINYMTTQFVADSLPKHLKIPERLRAKRKLFEPRFSLQLSYIKRLEKESAKLERQMKKSTKMLFKRYKTVEMLRIHKDIVVCEITFSQQLISFLEQTLGSNSHYVLFLKEYTRKEGENFKEYIDKWARRLMLEHNICTEEELDDLHKEQKTYYKLYKKKRYLKIKQEEINRLNT